MKKVLQLENLDCASCAAELEEEIAAIEGVSFAGVAFVNQKLTVECDNAETLKKVIDTANAFEEVRVVEKATRNKEGAASRRKEWILIAVSALFFIVAVVFDHLFTSLPMQVIAYVCFGIAYFAVGYPVLFNTAKNIVKGKIFDENFLMTVASIGAMLIGEISEAVLVMLLYQIGETLQSIAVDSSRKSIAALMELKSEEATLVKEDGTQVKVTPEELCVGERVLVKAGEKIPVDGELLGDVALLDTKSMTGEAKLKVVQTGGEVLSGCINAGAAFEMRVTRPYTDSAVCKILDLVENASSGKAAPEKFITKFARIYTPLVCLLALLTAVGAPLISGLIADGRLYFKDAVRWVRSALTFLVISCPCALIISVPLTYFSGIGTCAKHGILVKGATHLDDIAKTKIVAFDKTGTLTEGNFKVRNVVAKSVTEEELVALAAALERSSSHPIAKAFEHCETSYTALGVEEKAGRGLKGTVNGKTVIVGNGDWLTENGVEYEPLQSPYTVVYAASDGEYLGSIEIGDRLRKEAAETVAELKTLGVTKTVMLTGDGLVRAEKIAQEVGIDEVFAQLLPHEKLERAEELKREGVLTYLGDGINDAPVMTVADCSASMGKLGSAAAVEASDLVLITDDLKALPRCIKVARKTGSIVRWNIAFSIVMKVAFMLLGAFGFLPLGAAVFADVGVMLIAVLNSLRVREKTK